MAKERRSVELHMRNAPYEPVDVSDWIPDAQGLPLEPQTTPNKVPTSASEVPGSTTQLRPDIMQLQTSASGVGGRGEAAASQVELTVGQACAAVLVGL